MLSRSKGRVGHVFTWLAAVIALVCWCAVLAKAQDQPTPKWELYGGYSFFYPYANVHGQFPQGLLPVSSRLEANPRGAGASGTYNFNRWLGLTLDTSTHWGDGEKMTTLQNRIDDANFSNLSLGPKFTFRSKYFSPFLEVLAGDHRLMPAAFHDVDKLGVMAGGGLDINVSRHVALRLLRADFVYSNYRYAPSPVPETQVRGVRLQSGLNFMFGGAPVIPPSAVCSVQPSEVFAGEPVAATATGTNFNPKRTIKYNWSGTGVKVAGSEASTQIDTTGLQPGSYQVTSNLSDGSKHGVASCTASFNVKQPRPPVIACTADPASVVMGATSTIHSVASSPDGRRLTYSYSASSGDISGNGDSATLNTRGVQPGSITVTCNVSDDRVSPLTASSTTAVNVEAPPAPAPEIKELEAKLALHSIYFQTARPTAKDPEGGLVDSQADILKTLAADFTHYLKYKPDAHLILSGHADSRGTAEFNKALTGRRVERTKSFLMQHGVPDDRISTRSLGKEDLLTTEQTREQIVHDPDLTPDNRQTMAKNLRVLVLANNRRVDVSLSTTGQQSTRLYPFNAKDFLALIDTSSRGSSHASEKAKKLTKRNHK